VDLGSVRLAARADDLAEARREAALAFAGVEPPRAEAALAVGGSARGARRLVGPCLGEAELTEALRLVETTAPLELARRFGVDRQRAPILPAGVAILAEVRDLLGVPLHVCSGGIREGAVLERLAARAA
jgi:exopolyphosphatase/pppGpp-phosphohydrolase